MRGPRAAAALITLALCAAPAPAATAAPALTEFAASPNVGAIVQGPDRALWMTAATGFIGRMGTDGSYRTIAMPAASDVAGGIAPGPDGNLWVTNQTENEIDRFNTAGAITGRFRLPVAEATPTGITAGPDGALWFTERTGNRIGRVTTAGAITEPGTTSSAAGPYRITTGPDHALWFTEQGAHAIGRLTTAGGAATEFPAGAASTPEGIAAGPDGALWFADSGTGAIRRINTAGAITGSFATPAGDTTPRDVAFAADGRGWFSDNDPKLHHYGRFDTAGRIATFPTGGGDTLGVAAGPGCTVWVTEPGAAKVGRIKPDTCPSATAPPANVVPPGLAPPVLGSSVDAEVVKGVVLVKLPGSSAFVPLSAARQLPIGTTFDTTHGAVRLVFATDTHGGTRTGDFFGGVFVTRQAKVTGAVAELRLTGGSFAACGAAGKRSLTAARRRSSRRIRHLWGNARGSFRTRGTHSAATVRGTYWYVADRCDGTLTKVRRGVVAVRDFKRRKTVLVRAGRSYLARR